MMPPRTAVPPSTAATAVSPVGGSAYQAAMRHQQVSSDVGAKLPTVFTQGAAGRAEVGRQQGTVLSSAGLASRQAEYAMAAEGLQAPQVLNGQAQALVAQHKARILAALGPEATTALRALPAVMQQSGAV